MTPDVAAELERFSSTCSAELSTRSRRGRGHGSATSSSPSGQSPWLGCPAAGEGNMSTTLSRNLWALSNCSTAAVRSCCADSSSSLKTWLHSPAPCGGRVAATRTDMAC